MWERLLAAIRIASELLITTKSRPHFFVDLKSPLQIHHLSSVFCLLSSEKCPRHF